MSKSISPCVLEGPVVAECAHQEWTTGLTALPQRPYWFPFPPYSVMPFGVKRSRPAHLSYAPDTVTIQSHLHLQPPPSSVNPHPEAGEIQAYAFRKAPQ